MVVLFFSWLTTTLILPPIGLYLMALLMRLSIASRIRSASHIATEFGSADTMMVCCLLVAKGWLASATSLTRPAISTGSRRVGRVEGTPHHAQNKRPTHARRA